VFFPGQVGNAYNLFGDRAARGTPFRLLVSYFANRLNHTDTVTAVQISGPN
jgi:hypothetical protein